MFVEPERNHLQFICDRKPVGGPLMSRWSCKLDIDGLLVCEIFVAATLVCLKVKVYLFLFTALSPDFCVLKPPDILVYYFFNNA